MNGVRSDHRLPVKLPVQIMVMSEPPIQCEAQLLDMSVHGMGLRVRQRLQPGVEVQVKWDKFCFRGTVQHCRKQWKGYHSPYDNYRIGVLMRAALDEPELDAVVSGAWRKTMFTPGEPTYAGDGAAGSDPPQQATPART